MVEDHAVLPDRMRALVLGEPGGRMRVAERPLPTPAVGEVLVRVMAAGVNRADILQRGGRYPAPAGAPADVPGLEHASEVVGLGEGASRFRRGDRVFGIVAGGAQAEFLSVSENHLLEIPPALSWTEAAAVPEAFITAHDALVTQGGLSAGETVLIHAVGSGVGLAAVQLVNALGAVAFGTSRTPAKLDSARQLGMNDGLETTGGPGGLAEFAARCTGGRGFDLVLDLLGGEYTVASIAAAAPRGRIMLVGTLAGGRATIPLAQVLGRRLTLRGTVLRSRSAEEKAEATRRFGAEVLPMLGNGRVRPVVDRVYPLEQAEAAYGHVAEDRAIGKVVLAIG